VINARFDVQTSASKRSVSFLAQCLVPAVPSVGESINVKGDPYIVIRRGWALDDPCENGRLFAYITVLAASEETDDDES